MGLSARVLDGGHLGTEKGGYGRLPGRGLLEAFFEMDSAETLQGISLTRIERNPNQHEPFRAAEIFIAREYHPSYLLGREKKRRREKNITSAVLVSWRSEEKSGNSTFNNVAGKTVKMNAQGEREKPGSSSDDRERGKKNKCGTLLSSCTLATQPPISRAAARGLSLVCAGY